MPRKNNSRKKSPKPRQRGTPTAKQGRRGTPSAKQARTGRAAGRDGTRREREARRLLEIEELEKRLEKLRAAQLAIAIKPIPEKRFPKGGIEIKPNRRYDTWFKAAGSIGGGRNWDSYDRMRFLLNKVDEKSNAPSAFYAGHILGRVKWANRIRPLEELIDELNRVGGFEEDFRRIYPRWNYEYRVVESIGGVPVNIWVKRDKRPKG